jgi:hypothetical protein
MILFSQQLDSWNQWNSADRGEDVHFGKESLTNFVMAGAMGLLLTTYHEGKWVTLNLLRIGYKGSGCFVISRSALTHRLVRAFQLPLRDLQWWRLIGN